MPSGWNESAIFSLPGSSRRDSSEANTWETRSASIPRRCYNSCHTDFLREVSWCRWYTCGDTQARWNQTYMCKKLTLLYKSFWLEGAVPQDFKDAYIIHLYKRKGNRTVCYKPSRDISSLHRRRKVNSSTHSPEQNARGGCRLHISRVTVWVYSWQRSRRYDPCHEAPSREM